MNWIKNNILPLLIFVVGFVVNNTQVVVDFLKEIAAPDWTFKAVNTIGMLWAAYLLFNSKSAKIKKEIEEALQTEPEKIGGGGIKNPPN